MEANKRLPITEGEWKAKNIFENWIVSANNIVINIRDCEANAQLIADAGTSYNKVPMLPSLMLEAYANVTYDLKGIIGAFEALHPHINSAELKKAKATLEKYSLINKHSQH